MITKVHRFLRDEKAATAIEYGLIAALSGAAPEHEQFALHSLS